MDVKDMRPGQERSAVRMSGCLPRPLRLSHSVIGIMPVVLGLDSGPSMNHGPILCVCVFFGVCVFLFKRVRHLQHLDIRCPNLSNPKLFVVTYIV